MHAFLGLGIMGGPMARHLTKIGRVNGWNRTWNKTELWEKTGEGLKACKTVEEACHDVKSVSMCVGNDNDAVNVTQEALKYMKPGTVLIDHTTTSLDAALEMEKMARDKRVEFCDAPVSGGEVGAQKGILTIMVGGTEQGFDLALPVLKCYGKTVTRMGNVGTGQLTKQVNQLCIAGLLQSLSEAIAFGTRAGLDMDLVLQTIRGGAAQSWQMENRWGTMTRGEFTGFGFAVDHMRKDLGICLDQSKKLGISLPVAAVVDQFYQEVQNIGLNRGDTSSLLARYEKVLKK